jgi:ATP-dependent DNA ligase
MNPKDLDDWSKVEALLEDPEWGLELKKDGVRGEIHITSTGCRIFGRKAGKNDPIKPLEMTHNLPTLANKILPKALWGSSMDCEIWCQGKRAAEVAGAVNPNRKEPPVSWESDIEFFVFDLPIWREEENPYTQLERSFMKDLIFSAYLQKLWPLRRVETLFDNKALALSDWIARGEEGGVLKKLDSKYLFSYSKEGKRSPDTWVKAKKSFDDDFVITGFKEPERAYTGKNLSVWTYWESDLGKKYYGDKRSSNDTPITKFYYYGWVGAIEYGLWMTTEDYHQYKPKNKAMRIVGGKSNSNLVLASIGFTSGIPDHLRAEITEHPEKHLRKVVKISGMEQFDETLAVRHPSVDMIRWDKDEGDCKLID